MSKSSNIAFNIFWYGIIAFMILGFLALCYDRHEEGHCRYDIEYSQGRWETHAYTNDITRLPDGCIRIVDYNGTPMTICGSYTIKPQ